MKLNQSQACWLLGAALVVSGLPFEVRAAAPAAPAPKEVEAPKSVFAVDPKTGKDPFFPKSERWNPPPPTPKVDPVKTAPDKPAPPPVKIDPYENFELKGFVGSGNGRVVTISSGIKNYIMMLGESKMAVTPKGSYRFKIIRYTGTGVVIQIDGEKEEKELALPTP
jgi:hypothetical protein